MADNGENKIVSPGAAKRDILIVCRNSQGVEVRATPLRLTRYSVVFEVYNPYSILQLSEVLSEFQIIMNDRRVYCGRAVVRNLVNTGIILVGRDGTRFESVKPTERRCYTCPHSSVTRAIPARWLCVCRRQERSFVPGATG